MMAATIARASLVPFCQAQLRSGHARNATQARPPTPWARLQPRCRQELAVVRASAGEGGGGALDDLDVAVFRFTLGIPGFDDALIPRVVGILGAALLLVNHLLSDGAVTDAQARAEALGGLLAAVGVVTPSLEQLLKERQPGRGRLAATEAVEGATRVFALSSTLSDSAKQDAAWASFALLRNSNICGLLAVWEGQVVMCRGLVRLPPGATPGDADGVLQAVSKELQSSAPLAAAYWPDRGSMRAGGGEDLPCVPSGAQTLLIQPIQPLAAPAGSGSGRPAEKSQQQQQGRAAAAGASGTPRGFLLLMSERPRALSGSERAWAAAVAGKLYMALQ